MRLSMLVFENYGRRGERLSLYCLYKKKKEGYTFP